MFEAGFAQFDAAVTQKPNDWLARLETREGFAHDTRYAKNSSAEPVADVELDLAAAIAEARLMGVEQGRAEMQAEQTAIDAQREQLTLAFSQIDTELQAELATKLTETVAALCEQTLQPLAIDRDALQSRCEVAAQMLGEATDGLKLHLHPEDVALLDKAFAKRWVICPDDEAERGSLRVEGRDGDTSDGPQNWRETIREALGLC